MSDNQIRMSKRTLFLLLLLSAIFISACKKKGPDEDTTYPTITIVKPGSSISYNMFDTIHIQVSVSDDQILKTVTVGLTDLNRIPVQANVNYTPNTAQLDINIGYEITEYHLLSGFYYVMVYASDGQNDIQSARTIYIHASPIVKTGYYLFTSSASQNNVQKTDTNFASVNTVQNSGEFNGSAISNYYQRLYVGGGINQDFQAYDCSSNALKWAKQNSGAGSPYFSSCGTDGKNVFIGYNNGQLIKYDYNGGQLTSYNYPDPDYYSQHGAVAADKYIAHYQSRYVPNNKKLVVFDLSSGSAVKELSVNFTTLGVFEKSNDEVYILGNDNTGQGVVYVYTISTTSLYSPVSLSSGKIISACKIDSDILLIAMDDGNIYEYQYSTNNLISIDNGVLVTRMRYSENENYVYIASDVQLRTCQLLSNFTLHTVHTYNHSDTIRDFQVIFNK